MSKLVFPSVAAAGLPYRGFVSEVRTWLQRIASWTEKNGPESKTEIARQLAVLSALVGTGSPSTALVTNNVEVLMPVATGTYVNGYTFTVANGVITGIVAS